MTLLVSAAGRLPGPEPASSEALAWLWAIAAAGIVASVALALFVRTRRLRTVFVSYRRADSEDDTRRLVDALADRFGRRRVFRDVVSIGPGENFRHAIARTIRKCDAALVVVGPDWISCAAEDGGRRLHQREDVVRHEVAGALSSGALVIPVLVRGSPMPRREDLPVDLHPLADLQAVRIESERHGASVATLVRAVGEAPMRRTPLFVLAGHLAVNALLLVFHYAGGLLWVELTTAVAITSPLLAACAAATVVHVRGTAEAPARVRALPTRSVLVPLAFVSAVAVLVVLKTFNLGIDSFEAFKLWLGLTELSFAAYTGLVLASLSEYRRAP